jgi:hypothetical protein
MRINFMVSKKNKEKSFLVTLLDEIDVPKKIEDVLIQINDLLDLYPALPGNLLTVAKGSENTYPQNKYFNQVIGSGDNEINEWNEIDNPKKTDLPVKNNFFDFHLPVKGSCTIIKNTRFFVPEILKNSFKTGDLISTPVEKQKKRLLKILQEKGYYDKEGNRTKKQPPSDSPENSPLFNKGFEQPPFKKTKKNPDFTTHELYWSEDKKLLARYEIDLPNSLDEDDINFLPNNLTTIHFEDILSKTLLGEKLLWKSDIKSPAPTLQQIGQKGDFDDLDDFENNRVFKISELPYPILHQRVKTYITLIKKLYGLVLKEENYSYSAIEIIPRSNSSLALFILSDSSEKLYKELYSDDAGISNLLYNIDNILGLIIDNYMYNTWAFKPDFEFIIMHKDKSLRFKSILSKRLNRINNEISSLNKLHNKKNYLFEESDFDLALDSISKNISEFQKKYKKYFLEYSNPKNDTEISNVYKKLNKNQKKELFNLIKEEVNE